LRTAKTSRLTSVLAILGLITFSVVMVLLLNASSLVNPILPAQNSNTDNSQGPTGTLMVQLYSNMNQSELTSSPGRGYFEFPIVSKTVTVIQATGSNNSGTSTTTTATTGSSSDDANVHFSENFTTNSQGFFLQTHMAPGSYVVNIGDESLDLNLPVEVVAGNQTTLTVYFSGQKYPLAYSEESQARPTASGPQSDIFVALDSAVPVASVNESVRLEVIDPSLASGGYQVNATVLAARESSSQATQWLDLGATGAIDPLQATSIAMTTWTYTSQVTVQSGNSFGGAGGSFGFAFN
jgi:hypothetical protein